MRGTSGSTRLPGRCRIVSAQTMPHSSQPGLRVGRLAIRDRRHSLQVAANAASCSHCGLYNNPSSDYCRARGWEGYELRCSGFMAAAGAGVCMLAKASLLAIDIAVSGAGSTSHRLLRRRRDLCLLGAVAERRGSSVLRVRPGCRIMFAPTRMMAFAMVLGSLQGVGMNKLRTMMLIAAAIGLVTVGLTVPAGASSAWVDAECKFRTPDLKWKNSTTRLATRRPQ